MLDNDMKIVKAMTRRTQNVAEGSRNGQRSRHNSLHRVVYHSVFFFFQAEDGIRDLTVTGVQTCALPICCWKARRSNARPACARRAVRCGPIQARDAVAWSNGKVQSSKLEVQRKLQTPSFNPKRVECAAWGFGFGISFEL